MPKAKNGHSAEQQRKRMKQREEWVKTGQELGEGLRAKQAAEIQSLKKTKGKQTETIRILEDTAPQTAPKLRQLDRKIKELENSLADS